MPPPTMMATGSAEGVHVRVDAPPPPPTLPPPPPPILSLLGKDVSDAECDAATAVGGPARRPLTLGDAVVDGDAPMESDTVADKEREAVELGEPHTASDQGVQVDT